MKKLFLATLIIVLISSCKTQSVLTEPKIQKKMNIFEISVTKTELSKKITIDGIPDGFTIEKSDLIGSVVSINTGGIPVVLTRLSELEKTKSHENGAIVFNGNISGGDIIEFPAGGGWLITDAVYRDNSGYPERITISQEYDGVTYCILFSLNSHGSYGNQVNFQNGNPKKTEAGYEYNDACLGETFFINNNITLKNVYIRIQLDDSRNKKRGNTLKLPTEYN